MNKVIYPADYDEELKSIYDDLYSRGTQMLGKTIHPKNEFLLDLAAKITINEMRNIDSDLTKEEIDSIKKMHKDTNGVFETPPELYYDGLQRTSDGKSVIRHPLDVSQEEIFEKYRTAPPPKDVEVPEPAEENDDVDITILNTKIDEMLDF